MKILFVAPFVPSPERSRSWGLLKLLAEQHDVWLCALAADEREAAYAGRLPVVGSDVVVRRRRTVCVNVLRTALRGGSFQAAVCDDPALHAAVANRSSTFRPDVAHFTVLRSTQYMDSVDASAVVVDLDERRSDYYRQVATTARNPLRRLVGAVEAARMLAVEQSLEEQDAVLLYSSPVDPRDGDPRDVVVRSPNPLTPVDLTRVREPSTFLFVGRLSYGANLSALRSFLREVWPGVRERVPGARLQIVGSSPPRWVKDRAASDGVELHSDVPDVTPYYAAATVAVVPVVLGTGVQMKLIQALSAGLPTVSTPQSAHRAGVRHGREVLVAGTPGEWIESCARLVADPALRLRLAGDGKRWAVAGFSPESVQTALDDAYRRASASAAVAAEEPA